MKNSIIIAPHVSDECVGCFSVLIREKVKTVVYLFDLSSKHREEALNAASVFGFEPVFIENPYTETHKIVELCRQGHVVTYLPAITDSHEHHKYVNRTFRMNVGPVKFYSTNLDMCAFDKIALSERETQTYSKLYRLDSLYPSQADLWANNASYHLFESIVDNDYRVLNTHAFGDITITCDCQITTFSSNPEYMLNLLISPSATYVEIKQGNKVWKTMETGN